MEDVVCFSYKVQNTHTLSYISGTRSREYTKVLYRAISNPNF